MIDAAIDLFQLLLTGIVNLLNELFDMLFFWLPNDPFASYISDLQTSVGSVGVGLHWLNWFIDIRFVADGIVFVTAALVIYLGWAILREIVQFIYELLPIG